MRRIVIVLMIVTAVLGGALTYVAYSEFLKYQGTVDRMLATLPAEERDIAPSVVQVFEKLDGPMIPWLATRGLLVEICQEPVSHGRWHLRYGLWGLLLPLRVPRHHLVSLYAHYMAFEGGTGLSYGARRYYSKSPAALSPEETIALLTISRAPTRFSPEHHRDEYDAMYQKLLAQYHGSG